MTTVRMETQAAIATVVLNRPQVLNALNADMARSLHEQLQAIAADVSIRCVVLRGAGAGFMAGGDVAFFHRALPRLAAGDTAELEAIFENVHGIVTLLRRMPQPVIAQVHGAVAGFGLSLMSACDLVVAARDTTFTLAYCHIGASPDGGVTYALPRLMGLKPAMELALLGDRFDAERAVVWGLVNWAVPAQQLSARTAELAGRLAAGPATAYAHTKDLLNRSLERDLETQLAAERDNFLRCAASKDFAVGVSAFLAKRNPRFDD